MTKSLAQKKDARNYDFLVGGGKMGKLMRSVDWSKTPVGPIETWPQSLKTTVNMLLGSKFGMFLWWGPELVQFYNDAYRPSFGTEGEKHPQAMGQRGQECWGEIWDIIFPQIQQVMTTGVATRNENQLVPIYRNGILEEVYWTYTYSPIYEESGKVGGVLVVETETTKQVIDQRNMKLLRDLALALTNSKNVSQVCKSSVKALAHDQHDIPFALLYLLSKDKKQLKLTAGAGLEKYPVARPLLISDAQSTEIFKPAWDSLQSGKAVMMNNLESEYGQLTSGPWSEPLQSQYILPLTLPNQMDPIGILVVGLSPRRIFDLHYKEFLELTARQIVSGIASATSYESEKARQNELEAARVEAENARQRLRDVFMQAPAFIAVLSGPKLVFEFTNPLYRQLLGNDRPLDGRRLVEAVPDLEPVLLQIIKDAATKGKRFVANELPVLLDWDSNGTQFVKYLNFVYEPILDKNKEPDGLIAFGYEVTEQVQARKAVEESEQRFRTLADNIQNLAWIADPDGYIYWYNQRWYEYTGTTLEEMRGWGWQKVHHPNYVERVAAFVTEAWKKSDAFELTFPLRGQDGQYRWFLTRVSPIPDADGNVVSWVGTNTNVDEQKQAQEAIERSEARFRALLNAHIVGVITVKVQGRILEANDTFLDMIGYSNEDLTEGRLNWIDSDPTKNPELDAKITRDLLDQGSFNLIEKEFVRKDGSRVPTIMGGAMVNMEKDEAVIFVLDITERKKLEQRKDDFIALASHELKTPLTSLKMHTQLLKRRFAKAGDEGATKQLTRMDNQLNRLTELVVSLLDVARIEADKVEFNVEDFELDELIPEVAGDLQELSEQHTIIVRCESSAIVNGDKDRIRQVLVNLLTNATKYSPGSDRIIISCKVNNGIATVSVQDFGIGVAEAQQEKVFDRFFQVSNASNPQRNTYPGLGLGLYISSEIVKRHGGEIWVESIAGEGSTFSFTLPVLSKNKSLSA